eukprot:TRINITY_DN35664_c0_g1_i1.p3 TRINITY_DN35664_c0_g1~~TRINITY_DN35664_c0_g1_i1.p3  ORF type:complete len:402 (+),score=90.81 TRINITY_DN35664_c0_g1_i1:253-1458(+)
MLGISSSPFSIGEDSCRVEPVPVSASPVLQHQPCGSPFALPILSPPARGAAAAGTGECTRSADLTTSPTFRMVPGSQSTTEVLGVSPAHPPARLPESAAGPRRVVPAASSGPQDRWEGPFSLSPASERGGGGAPFDPFGMSECTDASLGSSPRRGGAADTTPRSGSTPRRRRQQPPLTPSPQRGLSTPASRFGELPRSPSQELLYRQQATARSPHRRVQSADAAAAQRPPWLSPVSKPSPAFPKVHRRTATMPTRLERGNGHPSHSRKPSAAESAGWDEQDICGFCFELPRDCVRSLCCDGLHCANCAAVLSQCMYCRRLPFRWRPDPVARRKLAGSEAPCVNAEYGCECVVARRDMERHVTTECMFAFRRCMYCKVVFGARQAGPHEAVCRALALRSSTQ